MVMDVIHRERDWAVKVSRPQEMANEEVWSRAVICHRANLDIYWEDITYHLSLNETLNLVEEVVWIAIGSSRAIFV